MKGKRPFGSPRGALSAFTLIEVMVTLALTMIMMVMFAYVFQQTGNFVSRQKGIAENDQSARVLTTALKNDLQARTMRAVAPFHPNMSALGDDALNRRGYFYYSENNPLDDTDDVLQFTIDMSTLPTTNPLRGTQLPGLATFLPAPWQSGATYPAGALVRPTNPGTATGFVYKNKSGGNIVAGGSEPAWNTTLGGATPDGGQNWTTLASPIDQADGDDGVIIYDAGGNRTINPAGGSPNNTGASQFAEVSYFLRHGNLYRRVLLIRQPYDLMSNATSQPFDTDTPAAQLIPGLYPPYPLTPTAAGSGNFWTDFDYAARIQPDNPGGAPTGLSFLAQTSPESSLDNSDVTGTASFRIGRPDNRFGFDQVFDITAGQKLNGTPREFALQYNSQTSTIVGGGATIFFGRYTHEETSNAAFKFPGAFSTAGAVTTSPTSSGAILGLDVSNNPTTTNTMYLLDANPPTTATSYAGGPRRGEDILLTNVVSFDVKLWDAHYSEAAGNDVNRNGVIDTGAAFADVGHAAATGDFQQASSVFPVYGPTPPSASTFTYTAGGAPQWATISTGSFTYAQNGVNYNFNNVFDTWYRSFNFDNLSRTYDGNPADTNLFAPAPYRPLVGRRWATGVTYNVNDIVNSTNTANGYVYQCTASVGPSGAADPFSLSDAVGGAPIIDGGATWAAKPPVAVQAIQITVKYLDPTQNLLRQVTIVQSLTQ